MRPSVRAGSRAFVGAIAAFALSLAACSSDSPRPSEDPSYEGSDVQTEPIKQVNAPFAMQTVAIVPFVNKSLARYPGLGSAAPDILSAMAIEAGFRVVESKGGQLDEVINEAQYGQSEFVDQNTAAKLGKQLGAKYVLLGSITDYNEVKAKGKKEFSALGLVEVGGGEGAMVYNIAVSSRMVDVETREVLGADSMTRKKQKFEVSGGKVKVLGIGGERSQEITDSQETMGAIMRLAFATSLNKVIGQLNKRAGMMPAAAPAPASTPAAATGPVGR